jgi:signal transduction histidine kinase
VQPIAEGIFILSMDITERKRLQAEVQSANEQLRRANEQLRQANDEVQQFAYIVSHDLRSPLINLKGFSEILHKSVEQLNSMVANIVPMLDATQQGQWRAATEEKIPTALRFIQISVERMDRFTLAILKLSRMGHRQLNYEWVDVGEVVAQIVQSMGAQAESTESEAQYEIVVEALPTLYADRLALDQIFSNVITNAIKYLDPQRKGHIRVWGEEAAHETIFHVQDNGRGISSIQTEKVFAPFRRGISDVEGEGMGLAYVQALLKRHDGRIWFDTTPDVGTTFSFTISNASANTSVGTDGYDEAKSVVNQQARVDRKEETYGAVATPDHSVG